MSLEEEDETREVASVKIHVERAIKRVKNYNILTYQIIPNSMAEDLNKIWKVCALINKLERMSCYITSNYVCLTVDLFCAVRVHVNQWPARVNYQSYVLFVVGGKRGVFLVITPRPSSPTLTCSIPD